MTVDGAGQCANGHPRSALRDVREGEPAAPVARPAATTRPNAGAVPTSTPGSSNELASQVIGKAIIIVPAVLVGVVMVGLSEPQFEGLGWPPAVSWFVAFVSVAITLGVAALLGWVRGKRQR